MKDNSELPQDNVQIGLNQPTTPIGLHKPCLQICDMCGHISKNRYASYIHNARHIIIPTERLNINLNSSSLECYFPEEDLTHTSTDINLNEMTFMMECKVILEKLKNTQSSLTEYGNSNEICEAQESDLDIPLHYDEDDQEYTDEDGESEEVIYSDDEYLHKDLDKEKRALKNENGESIDQSTDLSIDSDSFDSTTTEPFIGFQDVAPKLGVDSASEETILPNIRNRIIFEDDVMVSLASMSVGSDDETTKINSVTRMSELKPGNSQVNDSNEYHCVPFERLIEPGCYKCRRCPRVFPTWSLLIQHEPSHMFWKKPRQWLCPYCDRFITQSHRYFARHIQQRHMNLNLELGSRKPKRLCEHCGLRYYNYRTHKAIYHQHLKTVPNVSMSATGSKDQSTDVEKVSVKELNVCQLCAKLFKDAKNCHYVFLKLKEYEKQAPCENCGKMYFQLMCIKRQYIMSKRAYIKKGKKPLSNKDKLKLFNNRLKLLKK